MTLGQKIIIGPFNFHFIRILIFIGLLRILVRKENLTSRLNRLDKLLLLWGLWTVCSGLYHATPYDATVYRLGVVFNSLGIYFLTRVLVASPNDIRHLIQIIAILLVPLAIEMILEQATGRNLFSVFGGAQEAVTVRNGRLRAQGPFSHAILAGTVAASLIPLMGAIYSKHRAMSLTGVVASLAVVITCASSGPIMSTLFATAGLCFWALRRSMRMVRYIVVCIYLALEVAMTRPAYFVIASIDLTGSSTGWHRAELIRSTFSHLGEWWLAGTDYTRHWMPTGVPFSSDHTDITNHYIANAVSGGLPQAILFISCLVCAFSFVGTVIRECYYTGSNAWLAWCIGSSLFAHAASCISVAYFDQSFLFLYATLAMIATLKAVDGIAIDEDSLNPSPHYDYK